MLFLISLSAALIFTALCGNALKKHPTPFYLSFTAAAVIFAVIPLKNAPYIVTDYLAAIFTKGSLAAAFFALVMFAGAFMAGSKGAKKLMPVRAELAIMASFLTITHLVSYGFLYVKRLIVGQLSPTQATVTYFAIPLVMLLLPLAVTSFKKGRKKMEPKKWKKQQRFAYVFYALLYVHILLAYMPSARHGKIKSAVNVIVYSAVFLTYAAMRIYKALAKKYKESSEKLKVSLSGASVLAFAAVSIIAVIPFAQTANMEKADTIDPKIPSSIVTSSEVPTFNNVSSNNITNTSSKTEDKVTSSCEGKKSSMKQESGSSKAVSSDNSVSKTDTSKAVSSLTVSRSSTEQSHVQSERVTEQQTEIPEIKEQNNEPEIQHEPVSEQKNDESTVMSETSEYESESVPENIPETETERIYRDGEYTSKVYEEDDDVRVMITVTITVENDRIVNIKADSDETDTWYLDNVLENLVPTIIEREGTSLDSFDDVDAVSGATLSSNGIKRAIADALSQAKRTA